MIEIILQLINFSDKYVVWLMNPDLLRLNILICQKPFRLICQKQEGKGGKPYVNISF